MEYPQLGLPLALELINTQFALGGQPRDALQTPLDLQAWIELNSHQLDTSSHGLEPTEGDLERFRELRLAMRGLFGAAAAGGSPNTADVRTVNDASAAAPRFEWLDWSGAQTPRAQTMSVADGFAWVLAAVARSAIGLLAGGIQVQQCQAPGCVLFFTRETRRRQWCSAACGNRARVARHYSRHKRQMGPAQRAARRKGRRDSL